MSLKNVTVTLLAKISDRCRETRVTQLPHEHTKLPLVLIVMMAITVMMSHCNVNDDDAHERKNVGTKAD